MPRYVRAPRPTASFDYPEPLLPILQVDAVTPQDSGVLDVDGTKLFKLLDEIGFLRAATRQMTER